MRLQVHRQVNAFRKVLSQQTIGVLMDRRKAQPVSRQQLQHRHANAGRLSSLITVLVRISSSRIHNTTPSEPIK
jgi:hypothetical protein